MATPHCGTAAAVLRFNTTFVIPKIRAALPQFKAGEGMLPFPVIGICPREGDYAINESVVLPRCDRSNAGFLGCVAGRICRRGRIKRAGDGEDTAQLFVATGAIRYPAPEHVFSPLTQSISANYPLENRRAFA